MRRLDLTNKRFGKLVAIESLGMHPVGNQKRKETRWKCKCDCGNEVIVSVHKLTTRHTRSCGCMRKIEGDNIL